MIILSKNVFNRMIAKKKGKLILSKEEMSRSADCFDYIKEVREKSVKSCIGYITLAVGMLNYTTSMFFISEYIDYNNTVDGLNLDQTEC